MSKSEKNKFEVYKSNFTVALFLLILFIIFREKYFADYLLFSGIGVIFITLLIYQLGVIFYTTWQKLGFFLNFINSKLILGFFYIFFLTPIALFSKLFRKDNLQIKKQARISLFKERNYSFKKSDFEELS